MVGTFTEIGSIDAVNIAAWDGSFWNNLHSSSMEDWQGTLNTIAVGWTRGPSPSSSHSNLVFILSTSIGGGVFIAIIITVAVIMFLRRKRNNPFQYLEIPDVGKPTITLEQYI